MFAGEAVARGSLVADPGVISALLRGHWYDAVAALVDQSLAAMTRPGDPFEPALPAAPSTLLAARSLATTARRVLDLDAEDFSTLARGSSSSWAGRLADSSFPLLPRDPVRGALASLVPLYELMLEVLEIRSKRREPLQIVVTAHLIGEYFAQLAWQSVLGHAGDPDVWAGSWPAAGGAPTTRHARIPRRCGARPSARSTPAAVTSPATPPTSTASTPAKVTPWRCAR